MRDARARREFASTTPALVRFFKDREGEIRDAGPQPGEEGPPRLRVGIVAPEGIETADEERLVDLPAGAETAEFSWTLYAPAPARRYRIEACYLEAPSPLGLWTVRQPRRHRAAKFACIPIFAAMTI